MATRGRRPTRYTGTRRPPLLYSQMAITGMRDSLDPSTWDERKASLIQNMYPLSPRVGGGLWGRPGFEPLGAELTGEGQRSYQFTKLDGTEYTLRFQGGKMYTLNWSTGVYTEVTLSGVSLPSTGRIYCCTFADELIVNPNDGTNKPWSWDGTTFTSLTNAPLAYGKPIVHYAKLVFIKWSARNEIAWSEEMQPNVGYEATIGLITYDNAWTLGQTDQEALYALLPTNDALYYFRARSIGFILGEVTDNFRSTGTLEGISTTIGTRSPDGVLFRNGIIWFIDSDGKPQRLIPGGGLETEAPIWEDARETVRYLPREHFEKAIVLDWTPGDLVRFAVAGRSDEDELEHEITFAGSGAFAGVWRGYELTSIDLVKNEDGDPVVIHLGPDGYAYQWGDPFGDRWLDEFAAGEQPIVHRVVGGYTGYDTLFEKAWDRVDFSLRLVSNLNGMFVSHTTPIASSETIEITADGALALYGIAVYGVDRYAARSIERHVEVGIENIGRYAQFEIRHDGLGEQFGLLGWTVTAYPVGPIPETL